MQILQTFFMQLIKKNLKLWTAHKVDILYLKANINSIKWWTVEVLATAHLIFFISFSHFSLSFFVRNTTTNTSMQKTYIRTYSCLFLFNFCVFLCVCFYFFVEIVRVVVNDIIFFSYSFIERITFSLCFFVQCFVFKIPLHIKRASYWNNHRVNLFFAVSMFCGVFVRSCCCCI